MLEVIRITKKFRSSTPHFNGAPFKYGTCVRVNRVKPKKPNSAQRAIAKVELCNGRELMAYIPGFGHKLVKNSEVMVRGGRVPDMPGCRYHILRNKKDLMTPETQSRVHRRSKYGIKRPIINSKDTRRGVRKARKHELFKKGVKIDPKVIEKLLIKIHTNFL